MVLVDLGCIPSALIERCLRQLPGFAALQHVSTTYSRASLSSGTADAALHDVITSSALGSFSSDVLANEDTIFQVFKERGYSTEARGAFGLDARLDPTREFRNPPRCTTASLQRYGIDEYDAHDSTFTVEDASRHDARALRNAKRSLGTKRAGPHMLFVRLLGCRDVSSCVHRARVTGDASCPSIALGDECEWPDVYAQRTPDMFARNVLHDDPRQVDTPSSAVPGLRAAALAADRRHGLGPPSAETTTALTLNMHAFAWSVLTALDVGLLALVNAVNLERTTLVVFSSGGLSLCEHGLLGDGAPWDACTRTLIAVHRPGQRGGTRSDDPVSTAAVGPTIFDACGIQCDMCQRPPALPLMPTEAPPPVTTGFGSDAANGSKFVKQSAFALRGYFVRAIVARHFAVCCWFSLETLLATLKVPAFEKLSSAEKARLVCNTAAWPNPMVGKTLAQVRVSCTVQVFDHSCDAEEMHNLAADAAWLASRQAETVGAAYAAAIESAVPQVVVALPDSIREMQVRRPLVFESAPAASAPVSNVGTAVAEAAIARVGKDATCFVTRDGQPVCEPVLGVAIHRASRSTTLQRADGTTSRAAVFGKSITLDNAWRIVEQELHTVGECQALVCTVETARPAPKLRRR